MAELLTDQQILAEHANRLGLYQPRNAQYAIMRDIFINGESTGLNGAITSAGDLKRIVYNIINTVTRRYMDEMSAPHALVAIPLGSEDRDLALAESRSKWLECVWHENKMSLRVMQAAYYQSLNDKAVFMAKPDPSMKYGIKISLVIPESYLPSPTNDTWEDNASVMLSWLPYGKKAESLSNQNFDPSGDSQRFLQEAGSRTLILFEKDRYVEMEAGKVGKIIRHNWGFIPTVEIENISIPHQKRGQGDSDQAVGLARHFNEMLTDQLNVNTYLAHPIIVVRGSRVGFKMLPFGPRAVWELERDGAAEILTWAGSPPSFESMLIRLQQMIEDITGISSPAYGREIPSGVSGETIRSILAGFSTRVGAKQTHMGNGLVELAEHCQAIAEKVFPNQEFVLPGEAGESGPSGPIKFKPKEMDGFYRVQAIFMPQNEAVRAFTEIQKVEAGMQSRYSGMKRLGILNPRDEQRRILEERREDMLMKMAANGSLPQMMGPGGMMPGGLNEMSARMGAAGGGAGYKQPVQPLVDTNVPKLLEDLKGSNPGSLEGLVGPDRMALGRVGQKKKLQLRDLVEVLADTPISGKAYAEGLVVDEGATPDTFTLRVSNAEDIPALRQSLGALADRAVFKTTDEGPSGEARAAVGRRGR